MFRTMSSSHNLHGRLSRAAQQAMDALVQGEGGNTMDHLFAEESDNESDMQRDPTRPHIVMGTTIMTEGKYKVRRGEEPRTMREIYNSDPGYVKWVIQHIDEHSSPFMKRFLLYIEQRKMSAQNRRARMRELVATVRSGQPAGTSTRTMNGNDSLIGRTRPSVNQAPPRQARTPPAAPKAPPPVPQEVQQEQLFREMVDHIRIERERKERLREEYAAIQQEMKAQDDLEKNTLFAIQAQEMQNQLIQENMERNLMEKEVAEMKKMMEIRRMQMATAGSSSAAKRTAEEEPPLPEEEVSQQAGYFFVG